MLARIRLFDAAFLTALLREFRASMRGLLTDLCRDLAGNYEEAVSALRLPLDYFELVGDSLKPEAYANWKVVGWIEELNDLLYFIDLREQCRRERTASGRAEFARAFLVECRDQFFEHGYADELFPNGEPEPDRLERRIAHLCARLARQVTQESLWLAPGLPCRWLAGGKSAAARWTVPCDLRPSFERAELPGSIYVGLDGAYLRLPAEVRRRLASARDGAAFVIRPDAIGLRLGRLVVPLIERGDRVVWKWPIVPPVVLRPADVRWPNGLTLGASLIYRKDARKGLIPRRVSPTPAVLGERIRAALDVIERAWPEGARNLGLLTSRIVPLRAGGIVSFSYRHRPGLSFINTFDRDDFELIDDLIHEDSHHHLNLLLRKYEMRRGDHNQEVFYSPWRRSLRPLHGILHATFTFTMGALLFERLASWAAASPTRRVAASGPKADMLRAQFRCLEEVASVRYSIQDLRHAADRLGWLSTSGASLVRTLEGEIRKAHRRVEPVRGQVLRSRYGAELRRHLRTLEQARATYPLPRA
ncbi:MAG: HEXXH motif-containing putative peptide modification protein [Nitrospirota bacterium]